MPGMVGMGWKLMSSRIIARRMADDNHAVVTTSRDGAHFRPRPCSDCPWRKDAVGIFPAEAFRLSANTGADGGFFSAEAQHIFGCHQNGTGKPATCAGYILRGQDAIGWRIAVVRGKFVPSKVDDGGIELFSNYYEMAVANGVDPDDPALDQCRPWRKS